MGFKKYGDFWLWKNQAISGATTYNSDPLFIANFDNVGFQAVWDGDISGNFYVYASVSADLHVSTSHYNKLVFSPDFNNNAPAGYAADMVWNIRNAQYPWIYIKYINDSGSGTLNVYASYKDKN